MALDNITENQSFISFKLNSNIARSRCQKMARNFLISEENLHDLHFFRLSRFLSSLPPSFSRDKENRQICEELHKEFVEKTISGIRFIIDIYVISKIISLMENVWIDWIVKSIRIKKNFSFRTQIKYYGEFKNGFRIIIDK